MHHLTDPFLISSDRFDGPVLLTGASGCIGAWVLAILARSGVQVIAADLKPDPRRAALIMGDAAADQTWVSLDVTDGKAVTQLAQKRGAQAIIHLAGLQIPFCAAAPAAGARVNVEGTINIFEAARATGIMRTVYASSVAALGFPAGGAWKETLYGAYKTANENTAQVYWNDWQVPTVALRPNVVYGLGRDQGMSSKSTIAIQAAAMGRDYEVPFAGRLSWLYAGEAAAAFIAAVSQDGTGAFAFDLNGDCMTMEAGIKELRTLAPGVALSCTGSPFPFPPDLSDAPLRAHVPGYPSVSPQDGIYTTFTAFEELIAEGRIPDLPV